jgi:hypothetical protein
VAQGGQEPTIPSQVSLETRAGEAWLSHAATIVDLSRNEVWVGVEEPLAEPLDPDGRVRLVLRHSNGPTQTAETVVLRRIGPDGQVLALMRPKIWDPPSQRAHSRARLAIPVFLHPDVDAPPVPARTTNIGVGGVYCLTSVRVAVGRQLPISLRLTPAESFECGAEVVRVDEDTDDPTGRQVVIAFRLLDLSEEAEATLASALAALADDVDEEFVPLAWRNLEAEEAAS